MVTVTRLTANFIYVLLVIWQPLGMSDVFHDTESLYKENKKSVNNIIARTQIQATLYKILNGMRGILQSRALCKMQL